MEDRNQIEEVFIRLGLRPSEITNSDMDIIEKFVTNKERYFFDRIEKRNV